MTVEHSGVKGMRWGVRKAQNHPDVGNGKRVSGRKAKKAARLAANQKKANDLMSHAMKKPMDLILVNGHTVTTGKEFMDHMMLGGMLDVKTSRIYAKRDAKSKTYVLQ